MNIKFIIKGKAFGVKSRRIRRNRRLASELANQVK